MRIIQALNYDGRNKSFGEFHINSCGKICEIDVDTGVRRLEGREDYQLIFIKSGPFYVKFFDEWQTLSGNKIILFKKGEIQRYKCLKNEGAEYMWVHFDGQLADSLLKSAGIYGKSCFDAKINSRYEKIILSMISELTRKSKEYEFKALGLFSELIGEIVKGQDTENLEAFNLLRPALNDMEQNPENKKNVLEYAKLCNLSEFYFLHKFKELMGKTPMQYKNEILMKQAAYLVENTSIPINEISLQLGIEDSMYFCKKFKSFYGISPTNFRKKELHH